MKVAIAGKFRDCKVENGYCREVSLLQRVKSRCNWCVSIAISEVSIAKGQVFIAINQVICCVMSQVSLL